MTIDDEIKELYVSLKLLTQRKFIITLIDDDGTYRQMNSANININVAIGVLTRAIINLDIDHTKVGIMNKEKEELKAAIRAMKSSDLPNVLDIGPLPEITEKGGQKYVDVTNCNARVRFCAKTMWPDCIIINERGDTFDG